MLKICPNTQLISTGEGGGGGGGGQREPCTVTKITKAYTQSAV